MCFEKNLNILILCKKNRINIFQCQFYNLKKIIFLFTLRVVITSLNGLISNKMLIIICFTIKVDVLKDYNKKKIRLFC